jgi:Asp-tRNA(Asn)/Glu-tRNA(Gln) amidotransferase B subunit
MVLDTEVYSNTGGQKSKSTRMGSVAEFASSGKLESKKDLFKIAMSIPNVYVASISMGANMQQTLKVFKEAKEHNGPSLIIAYSPCIEQGIVGGLSNSLEENKITSKQAKEVFAEMLATNKMPSEIIKEKGMEQVSDSGAIDKIVQDVLAANPKAIEDFKNGKTNVVGWLMGQVMKLSQGKANPKQATEILNKYLGEL